MDAVTYPAADVLGEIQRRYVPLRLDFHRDRELARRYHVIWTPTLLAETASRVVVREHAGFMPASDMVPWLRVAAALGAVRSARYGEAAALLRQVADGWPTLDVAPEALYWLGIVGYLTTRQHGLMEAAWGELRARWPASAWARRASYVV